MDDPLTDDGRSPMAMENAVVAEGGFVGRAAVLPALRSAVDAALAGEPRLVLLTGEAGIGKTALARQAIRHAEGRGARTGWGTCWDGDGAPAYWPWRQVLRELDPPADMDLLEAAGPETGADARFRMFNAIADLVASVAAPHGLVMVIDDLHWADAGTLRLLAFLIRQLRSARLLVVATFRDVDPSPEPALRGFLGDVAAAATTLGLTGLAEAEVAALLDGVDGVAGPVPAEVAAAVRARTGGNPWFVLETGRLMVSEGVLAPRSVPVAVRDIIDRRLGRLAPRVRAALAAAALCGSPFRVDLLAEVTAAGAVEVESGLDVRPPESGLEVGQPESGLEVGQPESGLEVGQLEADLEAAVRERIVEPAPPEEFRFSHDLFREALAAGLDPTTRQRLHGRIGDALRRRGRGAAEVAAHYARAGVGPAVVVEMSLIAAREATAGLAYEEAVRQLRRAVSLVAPARSGEVWLELGDAARRAGDTAQARAAYDEAARSPDAVLVAGAALGRHVLGTSSEESHREVIGLLERARDGLAGAPPSPLEARVLAALARELADGVDADRDRAEGLAEEAVRLARSTEDGRTLAFCLFAQHDVVWAPGSARRRLALAGEMAAAAGDDPELAFEAAFCRFIALADLGDAGLDVALRDLAQLADTSRLPRQRFFVTSRRATLAILRGDDALAERWMREADELGAMIGHPDTMGVRLTQLLMLGLAREGPAVAPRLEREHGQVAPAEFEPEMRALAALAEGEPEVAAAIVRAAEPALQRARFRWRALSALALDAEVAVRARAVDLCERLYDAMLPFADEVVDIGGATALLGPVPMYLGLLGQVTGRPDAAGHLVRGLETVRRLGAIPLIRRIEAALAAPDVDAVFQCDGRVWTVGYAGTTARLADAKGLHDIAALLANPGTDLSALHLLAGADTVAVGSDEVLDETARAAYRKRLTDLDEALDAAALDGDPARLAALGAERDALLAELSSAAGLGGRNRRLGDPGERARTTVTARVRDALRKLDEAHPALGEHLRRSLTTGRVCRYDPADAVRWRL